MNELELMQGVAVGDPKCVQTLVDLHYEPIFRLLRHLSGNREDAEDLTQDVFLSARAHGRSFRGASSLKTWLTRMAINAHTRHVRREKLRRALRFETQASVDVAPNLIDSEWLLAGLMLLSREHRIAVLLYDVHQFSIKEVAAITGCPEGTVKARLHYGRKRLREILLCQQEGVFHEK